MFHLGKIRIHRDQGRVEQNQSFTWILDTFLESFYVLHQFLSNLPEQHLDRPQANLSERETFQRFPDCPYVLLVRVVSRNLHHANLASHSGSNNSFLFTISGHFLRTWILASGHQSNFFWKLTCLTLRQGRRTEVVKSSGCHSVIPFTQVGGWANTN